MNVEQILKDNNIKYVDAGKDFLIKCLNPEHDDSHPSMRVHKILGVYHCFSCGHKGNIFEKTGNTPNEIEQKIAILQNKISDMLANRALVKPTDTVLFEEDYRNIKKETYQFAEAFMTNQIKELAGRICFPLYDSRLNIKVFLGRAVHSDLEEKYYFYPRGVVPPLFPAYPKIYKNTLFIVEGIFDALNLIDKGLPNVICAFGTHTLLKTHKEKLSHYKILGVNKFYIMFDGDKAGINAAKKLEKVLKENKYNVEIVELPENVDPGDLTQEQVDVLKTGLFGNEDSIS